jgi:hypothetical protein
MRLQQQGKWQVLHASFFIRPPCAFHVWKTSSEFVKKHEERIHNYSNAAKQPCESLRPMKIPLERKEIGEWNDLACYSLDLEVLQRSTF